VYLRSIMKIKSLITFTAILSFMCVNTGFAATAAILNSAGKVQVNGRSVPSTTAVFAGDRVETTGLSTGTVSISNSSLRIHADSGVILSSDGLEILKGGATVKTSTAYQASVKGISIRPVANTSEFMVQAEAGKVTISALKGSLAVGAHIKLPQGQTLVIAATPAQPQGTGCVDGHKTDASGKFLLDAQGRFINCVDQNAAGSTPVNTISDNTKQWTIISLGAAGAAGGIAAALIANQEKEPISPSAP